MDGSEEKSNQILCVKESLLLSKVPQGISVLVQLLQKHQRKSVELTHILCITKGTEFCWVDFFFPFYNSVQLCFVVTGPKGKAVLKEVLLW